MKSVTIGLIIKAPVGDAPEANRFYAPVMAGIEELCRVRDIDLLFTAMPVDHGYHPLTFAPGHRRATDGLIIIGAHLAAGRAARWWTSRRPSWWTRTRKTPRSTRSSATTSAALERRSST